MEPVGGSGPDDRGRGAAGGRSSNEDIAARYRHWADVEAAGTSPQYADWAHGVADTPELVEHLADLGAKRQPNLVFGAARWIGIPDAPWSEVEHLFLEKWDQILPVIRTRATQTNEAARCATLLPALQRIHERTGTPLALLEIGAAAGLCLLPDHYAYRYRTDAFGATGADRTTDISATVSLPGLEPPVLDCELRGDWTTTSAEPDRGWLGPPSGIPPVAWRAGLDLNPLDAADPDTTAWLQTLVWPEHHERRARLRQAGALAAQVKPRILPGDLSEPGVPALHRLVEQVPGDLTLVVFHTAVLAYLPDDARLALADTLRELPGHWVSQEGVNVLPDVHRGAAEAAAEMTEPFFVQSVDGEPTALVGPHGAWIQPL